MGNSIHLLLILIKDFWLYDVWLGFYAAENMNSRLIWWYDNWISFCGVQCRNCCRLTHPHKRTCCMNSSTFSAVRCLPLMQRLFWNKEMFESSVFNEHGSVWMSLPTTLPLVQLVCRWLERMKFTSKFPALPQKKTLSHLFSTPNPWK